MTSLEKLNAKAIEKEQLKKILGGSSTPECTLDTVTVGKANPDDGDDSNTVGDTPC